MIEIFKIIRVENGTAEILGENLMFTPHRDFIGLASVEIEYLDENEKVLVQKIIFNVGPSEQPPPPKNSIYESVRVPNIGAVFYSVDINFKN